MTVSAVLDAAGRRRSPATMPGYHAGRPPGNKGRLYPADPPTVEEIVAVMREANDARHGDRLRALIVVLWRGSGGLRVAEALALTSNPAIHAPNGMSQRQAAATKSQTKPMTPDRSTTRRATRSQPSRSPGDASCLQVTPDDRTDEERPRAEARPVLAFA